MTNHITTPCLPQLETKSTADLFDNWFDPVETGLRDRAREFLQAMLEAELEEVLGRSRLIKQATRRKRNTKQLAVTVPAFSEDFGMLRM
jgi:hypothetical protein